MSLIIPVSYTHLDVYKRQTENRLFVSKFFIVYLVNVGLAVDDYKRGTGLLLTKYGLVLPLETNAYTLKYRARWNAWF